MVKVTIGIIDKCWVHGNSMLCVVIRWVYGGNILDLTPGSPRGKRI